MKRTPLKPRQKPLKRTGIKRKPFTQRTSGTATKPGKRSFPKKKSRKVNHRNQADHLWQILMWYKWHGKCAMCGKLLLYDEFTGEREGAGHHLIGRMIYHLRHHPSNGILLCNDCHNFAERAPHHNPAAFTEWINEEFPELWEWVHENIGAEGSAPDYGEVCSQLKIMISKMKVEL